MGCGKFWLNVTPPATPPNPPSWQEHHNINVDSTPQAGSTPLVEHYQYRPPMRKTPVSPTSATLPIKTDLDWKDGRYPWQFKPGSTFFDGNGHVDHGKPVLAASDTLRLAVRQHSEWSNADLPGRFAALQNGEAGLPQLPAAEFAAFLDHVKGHCFWESVPSLPAPTDVWHVNPIYFIEQLQRCMVPFHHVEPTAQARFYRRCLNESLGLLKRRRLELSAATLSTTTLAAFRKWFGYRPASNFSPNTTYTAYSHGSAYTVPHVATLNEAKLHILALLDQSISSLGKEIKLSNLLPNYFFGKYTTNGAYVLGSDIADKNIHLGGYFVGATDAGPIPTLTDATVIDWDRHVRIFLHEFVHFQDVGGLKDITIRNNTNINQKYGPYGSPHCEQIAIRFPSAALMNADNFSFYVSDGMTGATESFSYLG